MANKVNPARPRAVFCRVGWMKYYGLRAEEAGPEGGGAFNESDVGAEASNYRESVGRYNGFCQMPGASGFNLPRVDPAAGRDAESVDDVLIIMVAKNPVEGGQLVVGWHAGASCFAEYQQEADGRGYVWSAAPERCVLLPAPHRTIRVPKGKGAMGQANVSYTFSPDGEPVEGSWIDDVLGAIAAYAGPNLIRGASYDTADECSGHLERKRVEQRQWVVSSLFGSDAAAASPADPFDYLVRRSGREERVLLFIQEGPLGPIELDAERLERVRGATAPITLYVISEVRTHVCNDELRFAGGKVHREENFCPGPNDVIPVVVRYDPSRSKGA